MAAKLKTGSFAATAAALLAVAGMIYYVRPKLDTSQDEQAVFQVEFQARRHNPLLVAHIYLNGASVNSESIFTSPWTSTLWVRPGEIVSMNVRQHILGSASGTCSITVGEKVYGPVEFGLDSDECIVKAAG
jgi:hypothetical protein